MSTFILPGALWKKSCISFIWFFIAINSYQAILAWYIAFGFLSILIPVSFNVRKQELIESVMLLGIGGANSILNQLIVKFLSVSNFLGDVPRSATLSLSKIFENLSAVLYDQKMIWLDGYGLITNGFLLLFVVVSFILSLTSVRKHTNGLFSILFTAFSLLISLSLVFLPQLVISSTVWLSHRTVTGIFVVIALMLCVAIVWGKAPQKNMAIVISVVVLLVNVICIFRVEKDVIYVNQKDHEEAYVILNHIREYEEKSGSKIEEICWLKDEHITYAYPNTYVSLNINQRAATIEWQAISILEVLSGRSFIHTTIVQEESDSLVQNRNWDSFVPEEQLIFDNNTLYYIVY